MPEFPGYHVLAVGDDGADLDWLEGSLRDGGFHVDAVRGAVRACQVLRQRPYGAVVADLEIADEGALAIVRAAGRHVPPVRVIILLSASAESPAGVIGAVEAAGTKCLRHPLGADEIARTVERVCAEYDAAVRAERASNVIALDTRRRTDRPTDALAHALRTAAATGLGGNPRRSHSIAAEIGRVFSETLGDERGADLTLSVAIAITNAARKAGQGAA